MTQKTWLPKLPTDAFRNEQDTIRGLEELNETEWYELLKDLSTLGDSDYDLSRVFGTERGYDVYTGASTLFQQLGSGAIHKIGRAAERLIGSLLVEIGTENVSILSRLLGLFAVIGHGLSASTIADLAKREELPLDVRELAASILVDYGEPPDWYFWEQLDVSHNTFFLGSYLSAIALRDPRIGIQFSDNDNIPSSAWDIAESSLRLCLSKYLEKYGIDSFYVEFKSLSTSAQTRLQRILELDEFQKYLEGSAFERVVSAFFEKIVVRLDDIPMQSARWRAFFREAGKSGVIPWRNILQELLFPSEPRDLDAEIDLSDLRLKLADLPNPKVEYGHLKTAIAELFADSLGEPPYPDAVRHRLLRLAHDFPSARVIESMVVYLSRQLGQMDLRSAEQSPSDIDFLIRCISILGALRLAIRSFKSSETLSEDMWSLYIRILRKALAYDRLALEAFDQLAFHLTNEMLIEPVRIFLSSRNDYSVNTCTTYLSRYLDPYSIQAILKRVVLEDARDPASEHIAAHKIYRAQPFLLSDEPDDQMSLEILITLDKVSAPEKLASDINIPDSVEELLESINQ